MCNLLPLGTGTMPRMLVFYRNWNNNRSNDNNNIGFRCSDYFAKLLTTLNEYTGNIGIYASCIMAKSAGWFSSTFGECQSCLNVSGIYLILCLRSKRFTLLIPKPDQVSGASIV